MSIGSVPFRAAVLALAVSGPAGSVHAALPDAAIGGPPGPAVSSDATAAIDSAGPYAAEALAAAAPAGATASRVTEPAQASPANQPMAVAPAPAAKPAPYSLPWLLRPVVPATVVRLDETVAFYEGAGTSGSGTTAVSSLIATYRWKPNWVPLFRAIWLKNDAPAGTASGSGFANPIVGMNYLRPLSKGWRWSALVASSVPIGSGAGDSPDPGAAAAMPAGIAARSGMDNTLFAVNYWGIVGGVGLARITPQLTLQGEMTVFQLTRVRGPESQDKTRTNFTAALHVGHFFTPKLSIGADLRMQRWMTDAAPVRANAAAREQFTFGIGPRLHLKAGKRIVRPGISYSRALDEPMSLRGYDIVQLDVPIVF